VWQPAHDFARRLAREIRELLKGFCGNADGSPPDFEVADTAG
jgi:hypothetical protein